jgi:TFIIH basal transcription factor complex TTD-A subunit
MVVSNEGVLIKCDPQMKQFILFLDEKQPPGSKIVLKDLDATHVFVETKYVETIKSKIEELMEQQV